ARSPRSPRPRVAPAASCSRSPTCSSDRTWARSSRSSAWGRPARLPTSAGSSSTGSATGSCSSAGSTTRTSAWSMGCGRRPEHVPFVTGEAPLKAVLPPTAGLGLLGATIRPFAPTTSRWLLTRGSVGSARDLGYIPNHGPAAETHHAALDSPKQDVVARVRYGPRDRPAPWTAAPRPLELVEGAAHVPPGERGVRLGDVRTLALG